MADWGLSDIGDLKGRLAVVTGASDGLGEMITNALVDAGAEVVMACRNEEKAETARQRLSKPKKATVRLVDLSERESVAAFAEEFLGEHDTLDLLINNAGVMATPPTMTDDGVELQWATNHLGHFALTGLLLGPLLATDQSRVVAVSSLAADTGLLTGYDPTSLLGYTRFQAYANSKRANLVFALELNRRLESRGESTIAVAAHPGVANTNLLSGTRLPFVNQAAAALGRIATQSTEQGALPILRAATDPEVEGGSYYGPSGWRQLRGAAVKVSLPLGVTDERQGERLWADSVHLSGVDYLT